MIGRTDFRIVAECLNWPAVEVPYATTVTLDAGEEAWRPFLEQATPPLRAAVLASVAPWLGPEMLATEPARARLRRWSEAGGLAEADTPEARKATIARIPIVGDDLLEPLVQRALLRMPPPVLDHLRRHSVLLPVGLSCAGFAALEPLHEPDAVEVRRLLPIRYGGHVGRLARLLRPLRLARTDQRASDEEEEFLALVAHEVAHSWLVASPRPSGHLPRVEAIERHETYIRCAAEWGLLDRVIRPLQRDEHQAEGLALAWGFTRATRGDACAWNAGRMVLAEAAAIAARTTES
jgi:hypothetical protein